MIQNEVFAVIFAIKISELGGDTISRNSHVLAAFQVTGRIWNSTFIGHGRRQDFQHFPGRVYKVPPAKWLAEFWLNDVMLFPLPERTRRDPCIKATNFARTVLWRRSASHHVDRYIRRYGCFGYGFSNWLVWRASFQISSCIFDSCVCSFSSAEIFWRKEEVWITERAEIERHEAWWPHLHRSFHPECLGNLYGQGLQAIRWINGLTPRI